MSSPPSYNPHYTIADYEQWEGDWELWNGVAVAMSPSPTKQHQHALTQLIFQIESALRQNDDCDCVTVADVDWRVAIDTVVRPDLSILCGKMEGEFINRPPSMIVEVLSPSTASKDRNAKRALYESQGVGWYFIVDIQTKLVECFELRDGRYVQRSDDKGEIDISLHDGCRVSISLPELFHAIG